MKDTDNDIVYLSGPMRGYSNDNFDEFNRLEEQWGLMGWIVINPARNATIAAASKKISVTELNRHDLMRADIEALLEADAIAMLKGWEGSEGANTEYRIAIDLKLDVYDAETGDLLPTPKQQMEANILQEAQTVVYGTRQRDYGHPKVNLDIIGRKWAVTLYHWLNTTKVNELYVNTDKFPDIPPHIVALMMIDLKTIRQVGTPKKDNLVDIAGYSALIEICNET